MRISLLFCLLIGSLLVAQAQAPQTKANLPSTVFDWSKMVVKPTKTGERREIVNQPTATFANLESHVTTLNVGMAPHEPHRHVDEEIVIVKEGTIEVNLDGKKQIAGAGSYFFFASNQMHGMKNAGSTRATYFVLRLITTAKP
jgi:quercetin dioxygenase-like cupin family protein